MKFVSRKLLSAVLVAASLGIALSACVPLMMGGAVMGSLIATDRRTSGAQLEDEGIELRAASRIRDNLGERGHVNVNSYNRRVLLTGEVPSLQDKQLVEQIVTRVENVQSVVNELAVLGNATLTQRSSDILVSGRVKAGLVDAKDLFANAFKVTAERGTIYLMGRVTQREADRATEITRSTSGVQKVVRVFEIISEDELRNLLEDMRDTMRAMDGVGLAAPQIGVNLRVVIFEVSSNPRYPDAETVSQTVLINPVLTPLSDAMEEGWEGCLSIPGMRGLVPRYTHLRYQGCDEYGAAIDRTVAGFHARVVQHECDHLDGILYPMRIRDMRDFGFSDVLFPGQNLQDD